eukprot:147519-Rhodomonas_salina.1
MRKQKLEECWPNGAGRDGSVAVQVRSAGRRRCPWSQSRAHEMNGSWKGPSSTELLAHAVKMQERREKRNCVERKLRSTDRRGEAECDKVV